MARDTSSEFFVATILFVLMLVTVAAVMRSEATRITIAAVLLVFAFYPIAKAFESQGNPMYFNVGFAILMVVAALFPLRLIGYRLVRLTGSVS